jgi:DNA-binding transcriptional LysR family regulator
MVTSQDLEFFDAIARTRSLAAASRRLHVTPSSTSQRLQTLERKLNVKLVERGVRTTSLTPEGEKLALHGRKLLKEIEALHNEIVANKQVIEGDLRILAPLGFGVAFIAPLLAEFQTNYPQLNIDLKLSDVPKWSDAQDPHVMIYIGQLKDSSLKCITLGENRRLLLAAPSYLENAPPLETPQALKQHQCIALKENDEDVTNWKFTHRNTMEPITVKIDPKLSSNVGLVVKNWAIAGRGIIQRSEWDVTQELRRGELVPLLTDYLQPQADIVALVSDERSTRPLKLNLFLDFIKSKLIHSPWLD